VGGTIGDEGKRKGNGGPPFRLQKTVFNIGEASVSVRGGMSPSQHLLYRHFDMTMKSTAAPAPKSLSIPQIFLTTLSPLIAMNAVRMAGVLQSFLLCPKKPLGLDNLGLTM
jgi:hypothetical protein